MVIDIVSSVGGSPQQHTKIEHKRLAFSPRYLQAEVASSSGCLAQPTMRHPIPNAASRRTSALQGGEYVRELVTFLKEDRRR
jgi:hypothetical protein